MDPAEQKIVQYLNEARASERALTRVLQSQIAMTPGGRYRSGLERHLAETRDHAARLDDRLESIGQGGNVIQAAVGLVESVVGQTLALAKTPFDLVRGSGGEEKVLKNAKDACATEALEIATYTAIERLARTTGDSATARLAASIRADEDAMLALILREIPRLTDAVVGAEVHDDPSYDVATTGAADVVRAGGQATKKAARQTTTAAKRASRQARKVPGVANAEGMVKGALAGEDDLAIKDYNSLTAEQIAEKLAGLSQIDLAKIEAYERRNRDRATVLGRLTALRGDEPWAGYDELSVAEVQAVLAEGDAERAGQVLAYERRHKDRAGVVRAAERDPSPV